jgi:Xaa-Pro aminopeptidase
MGSTQIQAILGEKALEGILFFSQENIRYLTGFSGSEGYLLAGTNQGCGGTDFCPWVEAVGL